MTQDTVKALSDEALASVRVWIQEEQALRADKRKHDAIARIKALAGANGFSVTINGRRGRPAKVKLEGAAAKAVK